jgi:ribosomal protein S27AE
VFTHAHPSDGERAQHRPRLEVADIVRAHGDAFMSAHPLSSDQLAVLGAIMRCRTAALGGHVDACHACDHAEVSYNSCRNRHCPKCQAVAQARWVEQRMDRVLPAHAFHVVFTLPAELRALVFANRAVLFDMLFACSTQALLELGRDPRRLGAELGITSVLHTWTRELLFHPHVHCIVTGGGLALDGERWISTRPNFLFPVRVLGALFRGKFLAHLREAYDRDKLRLEGSAAHLADRRRFQRLCEKLHSKRWVVYAKPPFGGPEQVFRYLGRYTHRVGLSNYRLVALDGRGVTFRTRGDNTVTVSPDQFLGRFLLHVLPKGFVKIRHHGLLAPSNVATKLAQARHLLEGAAVMPTDTTDRGASPADYLAVLLSLASAVTDQRPCPRCGTGTMFRTTFLPGTFDALPSAHPDTS